MKPKWRRPPFEEAPGRAQAGFVATCVTAAATAALAINVPPIAFAALPATVCLVYVATELASMVRWLGR